MKREYKYYIGFLIYDKKFIVKAIKEGYISKNDLLQSFKYEKLFF